MLFHRSTGIVATLFLTAAVRTTCAAPSNNTIAPVLECPGPWDNYTNCLANVIDSEYNNGIDELICLECFTNYVDTSDCDVALHAVCVRFPQCLTDCLPEHQICAKELVSYLTCTTVRPFIPESCMISTTICEIIVGDSDDDSDDRNRTNATLSRITSEGAAFVPSIMFTAVLSVVVSAVVTFLL